jgi:WD40 repeat protein
VSFSPDGKIIATTSWDKTVKLWSKDGEELQTLSGHKDSVGSVRFSPDGKTIATVSRDKSVLLWKLDLEKLEKSARLWKLELDELLGLACDRLRDYLKHNPNVEESDRHLCDEILPQPSSGETQTN